MKTTKYLDSTSGSGAGWATDTQMQTTHCYMPPWYSCCFLNIHSLPLSEPREQESLPSVWASTAAPGSSPLDCSCQQSTNDHESIARVSALLTATKPDLTPELDRSRSCAPVTGEESQRALGWAAVSRHGGIQSQPAWTRRRERQATKVKGQIGSVSAWRGAMVSSLEIKLSSFCWSWGSAWWW